MYVATNGTSKIIVSEEDMKNFEEPAKLQTPQDVLAYCHRKRIADDPKAKRNELYKLHPEGVNLSMLFEHSVQYCRERSVLAHILLVQLGIPSVIVSASSQDSRHSFVLYKKNDVINVLDAEKNQMVQLANGSFYTRSSGKTYKYDPSHQILVFPRTLRDGYEQINDGDTKYF